MRRLLGKHFEPRSTPPLPQKADQTQSERLGSESYVYAELPTPTSIRVLLLAPGEKSDDIHCYLSPCDLDASLDSSGDEAQQGRGAEVPQAADSEEQPEEAHQIPKNFWDALQRDKLSIANGSLDRWVRRHSYQSYTALSYVWGSVKNPEYITIDGQAKFKVTRNLYDALKCLRKRDQAISLWVDAICINQSNPDEKRIQIGLMRRVYRQAQNVVAYVPQKPEDVKPFMDLAKKILIAGGQCRTVIESESTSNKDHGEQMEREGDRKGDDSTPDANGNKWKQIPLRPTGTCIEDYDVPPEDDPVWFTWRRFFASPYFRRIWILQEFALAKTIYVHNGSSTLAFLTIALVMRSVSDYSRMMNAQYLGRGENAELTRAAFLGWRGLEQMSTERFLAQAGAQDELIDKIRYAFEFDATDPRDKIYALLGLVSDAERFGSLISYQPADTYTKVFIRFAKALVGHGYLDRVMRLACKSPGSLQLPSWVPDWSVPLEASKAPGIVLNKRFRAGGNSTPGSKFLQNQLIVNGRIVSRIAFMTSPARKYSLNAAIGGRVQDSFEMLMASLNELSRFLKQNPIETLKGFFYCLTMQLQTFESMRRDDEETDGFVKDFKLWQILFARITDYHRIKNHAQHKVTFGAFLEEDRAFIARVMGNLAGRCLCVTSPGNHLGLVPERAKVGDRVAIVEGAPVPFILKEARANSTRGGQIYSLVGDAFVLGMMRGERVSDKAHTWHEVVLV